MLETLTRADLVASMGARGLTPMLVVSSFSSAGSVIHRKRPKIFYTVIFVSNKYTQTFSFLASSFHCKFVILSGINQLLCSFCLLIFFFQSKPSMCSRTKFTISADQFTRNYIKLIFKYKIFSDNYLRNNGRNRVS